MRDRSDRLGLFCRNSMQERIYHRLKETILGRVWKWLRPRKRRSTTTMVEKKRKLKKSGRNANPSEHVWACCRFGHLGRSVPKPMLRKSGRPRSLRNHSDITNRRRSVSSLYRFLMVTSVTWAISAISRWVFLSPVRTEAM